MSYDAWKMMLKGVIKLAKGLNAESTSSTPATHAFRFEEASPQANNTKEGEEVVYYNDPYPNPLYVHSSELVKQCFGL